MKVYKRKSKLKKVIISFLIIIILMIIGYYLYNTYKKIEIKSNEYVANQISVSTTYEKNEENKDETNTADVIEEVMKSVCGISKLTTTGTSILSNSTETELGLGTGLIVSSNGYILSNEHVTGKQYSTCYVTIEDGSTYTGTVVWSNKDLDLSITKITADGLPYATLGTSNTARVGEKVYAIGNPIGYEFRKTVTSGIISAKNRTIKIEEDKNTTYMSDLIQTDATINPGNSGGPLIYENGEVIGINSVKITSAEGIGFAIPIDVIKPVINSFIEKGTFEEASLGMYVYDECVAQYLNLKSKISSGIYVAQIIKDGPADTAKVKEGDIINSVDGKSLKTINNLKEYIYSKKPGDKVVLEITRNKEKLEIEIVLGKK